MPELVTPPLLLALTALLSYGLGCVSFGLVMARLFGLGDLRKIGSGNIGATNVLRTGSKPAAALTLVLDAGKGAIAVLIARALLGEDAAQVAALASFAGHCFPAPLGFKGGKGVATFLGTVLALAPGIGALACAIWLGTAALFRMSSLAALVAACGATIAAALLRPDASLLLAAMAALVVWKHRGNIGRISRGEEPHIGA